MTPARAHLRRAVLLLAGALACAHGSAEKRPPDAPPAPPVQPKPAPVEPGHPPLADAPEALFVPGAIEQLQKRLADAGVKLLGESRPARATNAAIPVHGDLTSPKAELWAALWAVLRNSFVLGVESGLAQPRPTGSVPQARPPRRGASR